MPVSPPARTAQRVKWARRSAARRGKGTETDWYRIVNTIESGAESATVYLYDEVGGWCGVSAEKFVKDLADLDAERIELRINSPGGSIFDGVAIHNSLRAHPATVDVYVDGLAASIASVIAMAGDTITMGAGTQMMIHDGWGLCVGNAADMRELAGQLDKCSDDIAGFYARRSGGTVAAWRDRMTAETWYTSAEAVAAGLADIDAGASNEDDADASDVTNKWDLSIFTYAGRSAAPAPSRAPRNATSASPPPPAPGPGATRPALTDPVLLSAALREVFV